VGSDQIPGSSGRLEGTNEGTETDQTLGADRHRAGYVLRIGLRKGNVRVSDPEFVDGIKKLVGAAVDPEGTGGEQLVLAVAATQ